MIDLLTMGKYSWHVWSCFGLTFAVLIICTVQAKRLHKNVIREIKVRNSAMESVQ
jgi:heme exporter protein CcmD